MKKIIKNKNYKSMEDFEKEFYPNSYERSLSEDINRDFTKSGTGLASEVLGMIKKSLSK